jgi:hypothetical protein
MASDDITKRDVWDRWLSKYDVVEDHVPLFATDDEGHVQTQPHGKDDRPILKRHPEMETLLRSEGRKVVEDWQAGTNEYEGLIYIMHTMDGDELVPRYIGKAGKYGRDGEGLSANLKNVRTNSSKLARWGNGYAYHFGDLSAALLDHAGDESVSRDRTAPEKYHDWADTLFVEGRQLRQPVYFWTRAWRTDDTGPFYDFETTLGGLEAYLISLAADIYPDALLNTDGV